MLHRLCPPRKLLVQALVLVAALATGPRDARADEVEKKRDFGDVLVATQSGAFMEGGNGRGMLLGVSAYRTDHLFSWGVIAETGTGIDGGGYDYGDGAIALGMMTSGTVVRAGLMGVAGARHYWGVGRSAGVPITSGTTAFAGARALVAIELGEDVRYHLGFHAFMDEEVSRPGLNPGRVLRVGALLAGGIAFDL